MHYHPDKIEKKWQQYWADNKTFRAQNPKEIVSTNSPSSGGGQGEANSPFYVLDMFPYPSGAGLHVGHPLGYIASDIYARYKRLKGFNVLHPMGYDSFGLPAEQYAIQTGTHPAITTVANINTFRRQMDNIGFSFDWDREVRTSDPSYYKWTQWIFLQLFDAWYCNNADGARPISRLIEEFKTKGNKDVKAHCDETPLFSAAEWNSWDEAKQQSILLNYRIAYLSEAYVNWCPQLGTVLANDEVKDGVSERGGYPVERKLMKQWSMRITAYSQRLLDGLDGLDWSESLKEQQRNWIGRSEGASINFQVMSPDELTSVDQGTSSPPAKGERPKAEGVNSEKRSFETTPSLWDTPPFKGERHSDQRSIANADQGTSSPPAKGEWPKAEGVMNLPHLKSFRRELRKNLTPAEAKLWTCLKEKQLDGRKFRRQHSVGGYILDFYCPSENLAIELDGEGHNQANVIDYDVERTLFIEQFGIKVLRFENKLVFDQNENVLEEIRRNFNWRKDHPVPAGHLPNGRDRLSFSGLTPPASGHLPFSGEERHSDLTLSQTSDQGASSPPAKGEYHEVGRGLIAEKVIEVFTTRPDTIFGVSFMTLAPEHELVAKITTAEQKAEIEAYIAKAKARSDRERMADVKTVSGVFTGAYAEHPFTGAPIPIWIGDYVLAGYGTGAVMAVPSGDQRDWSFAKHFNLPIPSVIAGSDLEQGANESKEGVLENSDFLNGLPVKEAIKVAIAKLEEKGIGKGRINYRQRDAVFGRQRYWGEPIPIYYKDGIPYPVREEHLPIELPEIDEYLPTETGEPPLARAIGWGYDPERGAVRQENHPVPPGHPSFLGGERHSDQTSTTNADQGTSSPPEKGEYPKGEGVFPFELSTMPGWAGSSWYYLRYMDPNNDDAFCSKEAIDYWGNVNYYAGGAEHATGHLLYVRFWTKFLKDLGYLPFDEPAKKLVNQGMIQGRSSFVYRHKSISLKENSVSNSEVFISKDIRDFFNRYMSLSLNELDALEESVHEKADHIKTIVSEIEQIQVWTSLNIVNGPELYVDVNIIDNDILDIEAFRKSRAEYQNAIFILEDEDGNPVIDHPVPSGHPSFSGLTPPASGHLPFSGEERHSAPALSQTSDQGTSSPLEKGEYHEVGRGSDKGVYICGWEVEKMSKSKFNVVNPDDIIERYGADTLRLYEMFLGPLEDAKPWNTNGIEGVYRFLKKFWNLFYDGDTFSVSDEEPTKKELKALHATIKKVQEDIERLSFNTSVSQFMICVNELTDLKCNKRAILEPFTVVISTYAPHIAEELWQQLGHSESITFAAYPAFNESFLVEDSVNYPISFNGRTRLNLELPASMGKDEVEKVVLANAEVQERLEGAAPKKVIVVPGRIVNIVV
jgi:leucyl-tRNA synthetase